VLCGWRQNADSKFADLYEKCETLAASLQVQLSAPRLCNKSRYRSNIPCENVCDYYRVNVFIPLLEQLSYDIQFRFGPHQRQTYGLAALIPSQTTDWNQVEAACDKYADFLDLPAVVEAEYYLWINKWKNSTDAAVYTIQPSVL